MTSRSLSLSGVDNFRDLGGWKVEGDKSVRYGVIFRSAHLARASTEDLAILSRLHINTIVDLRRESELRCAPNRVPPGAQQHRFAIGCEGPSLLEEVLGGECQAIDNRDVAESYVSLLEDFAPQYAAVIQLICQRERLPLLIMCNAGKDRTGIVVALILAVLGAAPSQIVEEYALSNESWQQRSAALIMQLKEAGVDIQSVAAGFRAPKAAMVSLLNHLDRKFGGAARFLVDVGALDPRAVTCLREVLLER